MNKPTRLHYQSVYMEEKRNAFRRVVITVDLENGNELTLFDGKLDIGTQVFLSLPTEAQARELALRFGIPCQIHDLLEMPNA